MGWHTPCKLQATDRGCAPVSQARARVAGQPPRGARKAQQEPDHAPVDLSATLDDWPNCAGCNGGVERDRRRRDGGSFPAGTARARHGHSRRDHQVRYAPLRRQHVLYHRHEEGLVQGRRHHVRPRPLRPQGKRFQFDGPNEATPSRRAKLASHRIRSSRSWMGFMAVYRINAAASRAAGLSRSLDATGPGFASASPRHSGSPGTGLRLPARTGANGSSASNAPSHGG